MAKWTRRDVTVAVGAGKLPSSLSPTRAGDFRSCQLKYFFTGLERWRTPPTEHTALGNVVHDVAEQLYRLAPAERTRPAAEQLLHELWPKWQAEPGHEQLLSADSGAAIRTKASQALDGLFTLEDPSAIPATDDGLETWVEAPLYGAPVRGRIDRMTENGVWLVSDYKTGKVPAPRYVEKALSGLFTYAAALAASHPDKRIPDEIELLYLLGPTRIRRPVLRPYLLDHARALGSTWAEIETAHRTARWTAQTGPLCAWCPFIPACPVRTKDAPQPGTAASHTVLTSVGLSRSGSSELDTGRDPDLDAAELAISDESGRP